MSVILAMVVVASGLVGSVAVRIERRGEGYELLRGGARYWIRGAVADRRWLDQVRAAGGNSVRGGVGDLDRARECGLTVLVNIDLGLPRGGFDYRDEALVAAQRERVLGTVARYREHPAVLMWALGNELEIHTTEVERAAYLPEMNELARRIHEIDPEHPVMIVMGGEFREYLGEVNRQCPDLDLIGLNAYRMMLTLPEELERHGWTRPYVVTEFGPMGHWEVPRTAWGMPMEQTSTEKAEFYERAYRHAVLDRPRCLGAYVFYWNQKQEKTHTWYGLVLEDGRTTGAVDVMTRLWTGQWPLNRAPRIEGGREALRMEREWLRVGEMVRVEIGASDPDGDELRARWELRRDVADHPGVGGDPEPATVAIEGVVVESGVGGAALRMPDEPGNYRIFVDLDDGHGHAATANRPVRVEP